MSQVEPSAIGSVLVLMALIGVIGYGGWSVLQQVQRVQLTPVDQAPGVVADLDPLAGAGGVAAFESPAVDMAEPNPAALDRLYRQEPLNVPVMVARDGPIAAISPRAGNGQSEPVADQTVASQANVTDPNGVQVVAAAVPEVEIFAVRPAWVRVQAADGTVLFEKILDAGERYVLPKTEEPPLLRAGNSGSVYFAVNGQNYGPSAPGASVAKNVVLSPVALKEKYGLADLNSDPDLAKIVSVAEVVPVAVPPSE